MTLSINAKKRDDSSAEELRAEDLIPGVVYGGERKQTDSFSVSYNDFEKIFQEAGESTLIDFQIEGDQEPVKVVVKELQYNPVSDRITHIDLKQIKMGEEMEVTVELNFVGESAAVKALGGTLSKAINSVTTRCLPKDLINSIDVDLSVLETFEDSIKISDLNVPAAVTIVDDAEILVANVSAPLTEEQLAAMEETAEASVEDVEVEEKGKKEEEGETAPEEKKEESKTE